MAENQNDDRILILAETIADALAQMAAAQCTMLDIVQAALGLREGLRAPLPDDIGEQQRVFLDGSAVK